MTRTPCPHPPPDVTRLLGARDYVSERQFEVGVCSDCGLTVTLSPPDPISIADYYPQEYYGRLGTRRFPALVELGQAALYRWRVRAVRKLAGQPGRVLDIGCGPGALLAAFRRDGWEVQGTELTDESAIRARSAGISVHVGPPETWPWPDGSFDAVTLWHVLEHWRDPEEVLLRVQRLLRPGGALLVGVPNFGSPEARAARGGWFHLDVPRHLIHFTPASLVKVLDATGFTTRRRSFLAPEFDTFSFVQSAENRAGLQHNLLYNLLRGSGAKITKGSAGAQTALALLLAPLLTVAGFPLTALLGAVGLGSTLTIYAVKTR